MVGIEQCVVEMNFCIKKKRKEKSHELPSMC